MSQNFRAVIIQGTIEHQVSEEVDKSSLDAGTYFGAAKNSAHKIKSVVETILYIRSNGSFEIISN